MREDEYLSYDLMGLAYLVRSGQISESELTEFVIERIETINPTLNALPFKFYDRGRKQISDGTQDGPFKGVPFLLKDIAAEYAGTPFQVGSRLYEGRISKINSTIVDRYLKAGLVVLGKTSTSELGLVGHIDTDAHGPTRSPWDLTRSTGGSSGGAAAVVASRILPASHASDGGGSIRIPAAWSGVFGLKPSRGRVPYGPTGGEGMAGLSIPNALSLSVRDNAALLDVIAGDDPGGTYRVRPPKRPYLQEVGRPLGRLRIAMTTSYKGITLSPEAHAATEHAAKICADLGHEIHEIEFPESPHELRQIYRVITGVNMHSRIRQFEEKAGRLVREDEVEPLYMGLPSGGQSYGCLYPVACP